MKELNNQPKTMSPESLVECIPIAPLFEIGDVFAEGANKYGLHNWLTASDQSTGDFEFFVRKRYRNALRHLGTWIGEFLGINTPTGENHLAKVAWFCIIVLELQRLRKETEEE